MISAFDRRRSRRLWAPTARARFRKGRRFVRRESRPRRGPLKPAALPPVQTTSENADRSIAELFELPTGSRNPHIPFIGTHIEEPHPMLLRELLRVLVSHL